VYNSSQQASAAGNAANTQAASAVAANDTQWKMFQQQQANQQPWLDAGKGALGQITNGLAPGGQFATAPQFNFDPSKVDVTQDPGYKFRMQSGVDALVAAGSGSHNYGSGSLGVALQQYGQNLGSQEYGAAYDRKHTSALDTYNSAMTGQNTVFNRLSGVAGTGQVATGQLAGAGMNAANNVSANQIGAGNTIAQGQIGQANAAANGITGVTNQLIGGYRGYNQNQMYNNYLTQQNMNGGLQGSGYGSDSMNFSSGASVDNYGVPLYM
jgi:hypothetical protein